MKKLFTMTFSFILILALGASLLAAQEEKAPTGEKKTVTTTKETTTKETTAKETAKPKAQVASGKVVAISDKELKVEGKGAKTWTFNLEANTDKPADLKEGQNVKVWYNKQGDQNVATKVEAKASKGKGKMSKKTT